MVKLNLVGPDDGRICPDKTGKMSGSFSNYDVLLTPQTHPNSRFFKGWICPPECQAWLNLTGFKHVGFYNGRLSEDTIAYCYRFMHREEAVLFSIAFGGTTPTEIVIDRNDYFKHRADN